MRKERIQLHLSPEVATALRVEAAKMGTQGAMSKLAEKILREGLGMTIDRYNCYKCDGDFAEGFWLEVDGEEDIFYCTECAREMKREGFTGFEDVEDQEMTYSEMMDEARRRAFESGHITDDPEVYAKDPGSIWLVKDMDLVVKAFLKDIEAGDTAEDAGPDEFFARHGIEVE